MLQLVDVDKTKVCEHFRHTLPLTKQQTDKKHDQE